jgi:hypothetical protein
MIDSKSNHIRETGQAITIPRATPYTGPMVVARIKNSNTDYNLQHKRTVIALLESNLDTGDPPLTGAIDGPMLVLASKKQVIEGQEVAIIANTGICNATLQITRSEQAYDESGNPTGTTETTLVSGDCHAVAVSARMRQEDHGLLETTLIKAYVPNNNAVNVSDKCLLGEYSLATQPPVFLPYGTYRVDHIDRFEIKGLMILQLGTWTG